jgi:deoxyribose-phosphate aldolase
MDKSKILSVTDHTLLSPSATLPEIIALCDDALKYSTASVCIPPCYVKAAHEYCGGRMKICTVIGFPTGYSQLDVKVAETRRAILDGADEIDMVINIGALKMGRDESVLDEINAVKEACGGRLLKVIVECCLLTQEEKIRVTEIVSRSNADYIKTSTGFSSGGATFEDVELFARHRRPTLKIKAAGGISSFEDAERFIELGASRLGTSKLVKFMEK